MKQKLYPVISMVLILMIWQISVTVAQTPAFILPSPIAVFQALFSNYQELARHSLTTVSEAVLGLVIAGVLSFVTALLMDYFQLLRTSFYPLLVVSQTLPIMVLGPLLTLWFGFGILPKVILVVLMSYFPIVVSFSDALRKTSSEQIVFLKTMGASMPQIYRLFKIPEGMAGFFSGLKVAATYCMSGAIVGEWLSAESGLGYFMIRAKNSYQIDKVFAAIVCVIVLSLVLNAGTVVMRKAYYHLLYKRG
ncbi:MAG: ABC transporter permease [Enterococcus sp.]